MWTVTMDINVNNTKKQQTLQITNYVALLKRH